MNDMIISGGAENPSKQIHEQPSLMVPEGHGVTDSVEGEWQIRTLEALAKTTPGFRNRDFRNPQTGESIIPTEVYVKLQREVRNASERYQWKFIIFGILISVTVLLIPIVLIHFHDGANASSSSARKTAAIVGFAFVGLLFWTLIMMPWMNKSLHARMERAVDEFQGTFMEYGVKLGYFHESTRFGWNRSHMWLRRIPESQRGRVAATSSSLLESSCIDGNQDEQHFPPIFIHWLVPGEIHVNEKEYDPSMVIDQEVWTMIRQAHFGSYKPYNRYLAILMAALAILWSALAILWFLYTAFIWIFMDLFGYLEAWLIYVGFLLSFALVWFIMDRLNVRAWSRVADDVTSMLLHSENPNLHGTALKFETSPLPFRTRHMSRRYQLVRGPGNTSPRYTSAVNDGGKVDHDDCDDEHHMV